MRLACSCSATSSSGGRRPGRVRRHAPQLVGHPGRGRVVGYLQTAVVNGCRSVQRHNVVVDRQNVREAAAADAPGRGSHGSTETQVLRTAERDAVMDALRTLPARQREVLVLRYYSDLSEAQIAHALEISPGAVKTHAHRGLTALRRTIEPLELS